MADAITWGKKAAALTICLDHDGARIVRAAATAYGFTQAWHEVDAGQLKINGGRVSGSVVVVLNADWWTFPNPATKTGIAGRIAIDVASDGQALSGTFKARFGIPWKAQGSVRGTFKQGR